MWSLNDIKYSVWYPELRSKWGNDDGVDDNNGDGNYYDGSSGDSDDGVWIVGIMAVVVITNRGD